jgi:Nucleotidyltransferase of unknown function (DUF6036)
MPEGVFGRDEIIESLDAVAELLAAEGNPQGVLVVVGGSYLALHGLRDSTADVDTVTKIEENIRKAVETVAAQRDLRLNWLNDKAVAHKPQGLTIEMCEVLYERPSLLVLGPPYEYVFLMKLFAQRAPDYQDMVALWPRCAFSSAEEAIERYWVAYPQAQEDPHLVEYVSRIALAAVGR